MTDDREDDAEASATSSPAGASEPAASSRPGRLDLPLDAHLHTDLSPDADVPVDVYAALAVERGVDELAITDHVDFDPREPAFEPDVARRERIVREAAERWADRVAIRFGVEVTYQRRHEAEIREHLRSHAYDYTIGSVHAVHDSPYRSDRVGTFVAGRSLGEITAPYFDEVLAAIRSGLFDTLGHLDYVKRWLVPHIDPARFAAAPELYEPVLAALVEAGMALEVNASGLRQPPRESYPPAWAVARFRELGGRRVTTGSDAHRAGWFGLGMAEVYELVAKAGFDSVWLRRGTTEASVAVPAGGGSPPLPATSPNARRSTSL